MIRKSIKKKVVSAIFSLVIMVILLHGFTVSVAAAPVSGTLLFTGPEGVTNIGLMAHDNILINNVSGTDIPNIELDIYGALNESNATNGIRDGSVVYYYDAVNGFTGIGPIDVESGDVTQVDANIPRYFIIKSHNGAEFSFQSIDVYDYIAGNSPIKFEGFRDGISTGSNILQIISSKETFTLGNQLNQSVFQNVDEIRITNQNEGDMTWGIYAVINNIKINDPVVPQATPSFSPVAGAIAFGSTVTITSTGAEHIYYTTDGTDPGTLVGGSTLEYIAPITVNSAMTIKAIATRTNYVNSVIGSASYTQDASADLANIALSGTPSNFTFTGASDTYNGVTVGNGVDSITVTPSGAGTITVEGITVNSGEASASINLTPGVEKIITVVVTETGKTAKTYTIKVTRQMATQATPSFSPAAGAIAFGSTVTITSTGAEHIYYTTDGTDPGTAVGGSTLEYAAPITVNSAMTIKAIATRTNYVNSVIGSASYTQAASADLANIALSGTPSNYTFTGASDTYTGVTVGNGVDSITVTPSGAGTITVDAVTVNSGEASASINLTPGVEKIITVVVTETGKTAKTYTIKVTRQMATQATPSFSPAAGAIAFGSTVTITSTGAEHIYYTTDGTDPGTAVGGSTLEYAAPITVNSAMTIKAIATRTNYVNSVIGSASYTQAASADLANIALSGTPSNYTFTGASDTYTGVTVGNGVDSITVTPSGAGTITVDAVTVNSGEASAPINLTPGVEKIITVVVTETGKTAKTYTIKVILSIPSYSNNNSIGDQDKKGLIIKEQLQDESVPNTNLNNTTDELKEAVFTTEELSKIKEGEDAKVILKVTDISNSVSEDDKKLIAKKLDGDVPPIMYIDLSLYKKVGNGTETKITETNKKISISIEVPVELRNTDLTKSRTYQIVRIHDGEVTVIKGTYDSIKGLFTFETDRFSTYALTFVDRNTGENENFVKIMKDFFHLRLTAKAAETSQILKYTNISGADGYIIYGAICGSNNKLVKLADVSGKITSYNHKGLKKSTYYKYQVQAYKIINDKKVIFAKSKVIHSVTISKNYDNPKKLISEVSDLTLAVGESKKVTCQVVLPVSKKMKQHTDIICYETSNKAIAIVSPNGKIKAISRGSCYIYAYAQNGVYKKINVTIK